MEYSILIVDDESAILTGICDTVDWADLKIDRVKTASSGEEALEAFQKEPFDILLTDIRMKGGGINGLQLIRQVKRWGSQTRFIVLSAYDDFSYAKEAMQMSIDNYILKPINWNELRDTLKNSILKLDNGAPGLDADTTDMLRTNTLYKWCRESLDEYQFHLRQDLFTIRLDRRFYLAGWVLGKGGACHREANFLKEELPDTEVFESFDKNLCVIFAANRREELLAHTQLFEQRLKQLFAEEFQFLLGRIVNGYKQLSTSYATLFIAQNYLGFFPSGRRRVMFDEIIGEHVPDGAEKTRALSFPAESDALRRSILAADWEKTAENIRDIILSVQNTEVSPMQAFNCCVGVMLELRNIADEMNLDVRERYFDITGMIRQIQQLNSLSRTEAFLRDESKRVITSLTLSRSSYPPVINRVIEYTRKNYNKGITLRMLADEFHINANYLGSLFMERVGQPYSEYLNRCRMIEAKNLLLGGELKVSAIASMLGYSNPSYFYILFKKFYGVSPNEFRSTARQEA